MAGTWTSVEKASGKMGGSQLPLQIHEAEFTDDATPGASTVPALQVGGDTSGGVLQRFSVTFGTPAPSGSSFTVQVTDRNGVIIGNSDGTALTGTSDIDCNKAFVGPLYVNVLDNETASATAVVSLYVIS